MSTVPSDRSYTKDHEWAMSDGDEVTIGITAHAQEALGDIVFVELPKVGAVLKAGQSFGTIESVKAVSDLFAPVSGTVLEIHEQLLENPEIINTHPYSEGWMLKIKVSEQNELSGLLDAAAYEDLLH